jgi:uncharacterized protein (TIGR02453 family)
MTTFTEELIQIHNFLDNLIKNNNKDWFHKHKSDYDLMRNNLEQLVSALGEGLSAIEPDFKFGKSTDYTFRIYRDVRFSKDKSPYKNHIGIYLINGGRKSPMAGYYLHLQPGNSFVAGGVFRPDSKVLRSIRDEVYYNYKSFENIIASISFQQMYGGLWEEDKLKRIPRDFPKDSKAGEWLKYKSYIAMRSISDEQLFSKSFFPFIMDSFRAIKPFNDFLNEAIILGIE